MELSNIGEDALVGESVAFFPLAFSTPLYLSSILFNIEKGGGIALRCYWTYGLHITNQAERRTSPLRARSPEQCPWTRYEPETAH